MARLETRDPKLTMHRDDEIAKRDRDHLESLMGRLDALDATFDRIGQALKSLRDGSVTGRPA